MGKEPCKHEQTYVAIRHSSGINLVKCCKCGKAVTIINPRWSNNKS
jgi:hypothetical protein